jgi:hypothetical protein
MATDYITQADDIETVEAKVRSAENLRYPTTYEGRTFWHKLRSSDILRLFRTGGKDGNGPIPKDFEDGRFIGDTYVSISMASKNKRGGAGRRVMAHCNRCCELVCAGHLDQHRNGRACLEAVGGPDPDTMLILRDDDEARKQKQSDYASRWPNEEKR